MADLPAAVLFACAINSLRSPMAAAILRHLHGHGVYVDSIGVRAREIDGFAVAVMDEIGIDLSGHAPKTFDVVISLSPEAQHKAVEMTRVMACDVEFWNTSDPSIVEGLREARLDAYRQVRDELIRRIKARFAMTRAIDV